MAEIAGGLIDKVLSRGDLADLVLLVWALAASGLALRLLRELTTANRRFDAFVRELHRFNSRFDGDD
jgi:hypothetical protein